MARFAAILCLLAVPLSAFTQTATSSPQAITLATQALTALTQGKPVTDVTLNANVISIAGSDYLTGTGTFRAKGTLESRIDLALGDTVRSEVRSAPGGIPQGSWVSAASTAANPTPTAFAQHNCWTDAAWFFPALSSLAQTANTSFIFSYVGAERHASVSTQHIRAYQVQPYDLKDVMGAQRLSTMDFYLDPTSALPLAVAFQVHADNDNNTNIPMEIRFANYQSLNGILVPFHVQQMLGGSLILDIVVTNATLNTGLLDNTFNLTSGGIL